VAPELVSEVLTICGTEAPCRRDHGQRGTGVQWADVVHVGVNVWMWRVKGRLRPHWRVSVRGDPDEGDIRKCWAGCQCRRPGIRDEEKHLSTLGVFFRWCILPPFSGLGCSKSLGLFAKCHVNCACTNQSTCIHLEWSIEENSTSSAQATKARHVIYSFWIPAPGLMSAQNGVGAWAGNEWWHYLSASICRAKSQSEREGKSPS